MEPGFCKGGGRAVGEEDEAAARIGKGLAVEACRGFLLVIKYFALKRHT